MARKKYNHIKSILKETKISERSILPGMIVRFEYTKKGVFDVRPLVLVLSTDVNETFDGINLNYMNETDLQRMFTVIQSLTPVIEENILRLEDPYTRLQLSNRLRPSSISGKNVYDRIKARSVWKNAFRTYSFKVSTSPKLVDYDLDVVSGLKAGRKTTAETIRRQKKAEQDKGVEDAD
ncbi:MAG: hypothetical protein H8D94_00480 [Candidatus Pelagibacter sp.]|nr:hypothetical protein [Candidatus Pelagibacter sp.]